MSLKSWFNNLNGSLLKWGAKQNSAALCSLSMGHTHVFNNSAALRMAAERKNYTAFNAILKKASKEDGGFATRLDFGLGKDWDKAVTLAQSDDVMAKSLSTYEKESDKRLDRMMSNILGG